MLPVHLRHDGLALSCRQILRMRFASRTVTLWPVPGGDHRLETVNRAPLFARIRRALTEGGKR
ncbi:MAG TPA: hypothetical protein VFN71_04210 [Methylomirabilota bacterium]|nr:hypothetical protein [Methylomirabilota bacterium]